jgi:hypothetical protein
MERSSAGPSAPLTLARGCERSVLFCALAVLLAGCPSNWDSLYDAAPTPADARDTGVDARDANEVTDAADVRDARDVMDVTDAADAMDVSRPNDVLDVVTPDVPVDVPTDVPPSGRCTPVVDGTLGGDWTSAALRVDNATASTWGPGLNDLRSLRVCFDDTALYLGLDATSESANAIVLFLDRDDGAGTGITDASVLADHTGTLDSAISSHFAAFPAGFGADWVWGSRGMASNRGGGVSDVAGLRDVRTSAGNYGWIAGDETVCVAANHACEVSLPWSAIYGAPTHPAGAHLALFVRLGNADGSMASNQTLPEDSPTTPFTVSRLMRLALP